MKVSVILPIYNGASTLGQTLESLAVQTFTEFELIACIDGTYDGSREILEDFRPRFKQLTILQNEKNRGLGPTMNRLVYHTKGDYIAVAEQDDYYYPERFQKQVIVLDQHPEVGLVSGIAEFWDGEKVTGLFPGMLAHKIPYPQGEEFFLLNYRKQLKVVNSAMMFRKQVHIDQGLYFTQHYPSISVDWTYVLRFSLVSNIYGLPEPMVRLDRSADRSSVTSNKQRQFAATRELLRCFAYENPKFVSKKDYQYAFRTQLLLELGTASKIQFFVKGLFFSLRYFGDNRFFQKFKSRLINKFKK